MPLCYYWTELTPPTLIKFNIIIVNYYGGTAITTESLMEIKTYGSQFISADRKCRLLGREPDGYELIGRRFMSGNNIIPEGILHLIF